MAILLSLPTPFILALHNELVRRGSSDDHSGVWTITLTEYVFISGTIFVINARDGAYSGYYSLNPQFDNLSGSILFSLPDKLLGALRYFGINKIALRLGTDLVMTVAAFHRCKEVDWDRAVARDWFLSNHFEMSEVTGLEAETIPAYK